MLVLFAVSRWLDILTSVDGRYFGLSEANKLWANKDGDMDVTKNLMVSAIIAAAVLVPAAIWDPYASLILVPFIAGGFYISFKNRSVAKKNRAKQIEYLRLIRAGNWPAQELGWPITRNGKTFYGLFRWVYSTKPTSQGTGDAVFDMQGKLQTLAESPESEWFPK